MRINLFWFGLLLVCIISFFSVNQHELIHKKIDVSYGCSNGEIRIGLTSSWSCLEWENSNGINNENRRLAQIKHDSNAYNLIFIISLLTTWFLLWCIETERNNILMEDIRCVVLEAMTELPKLDESD